MREEGTVGGMEGAGAPKKLSLLILGSWLLNRDGLVRTGCPVPAGDDKVAGLSGGGTTGLKWRVASDVRSISADSYMSV